MPIAVEPGASAGSRNLPVYRVSSRMPASTPASVSGNMRPPISWRTISIDGVYSQYFSGTGLSQIDLA